MAKHNNDTLEFDFSALTQKLAREAEEAPKTPEERTVTVGELSRLLRGAVETPFARGLWARGEVVQAKLAPRGHLYFTLKDEDEDAAIDCVVYKTQLTAALKSRLVDGAQVRIKGKPTYWAPRGRLQFVVDRAEAIGRGALLEALEKLKAKLAAEGLFSAERKRALPTHAKVIGVVTSRTGAVVHDIRKVAFRRGGAHILLAPATVQGNQGAASVMQALAALLRVSDVDVIILARGGGSAEDLMCFNDEALVRAVAASPVPIVSAVGHETDFTLCDFAADARAATPSQAAEMVVPDRAQLASDLLEMRSRMARSALAKVGTARRSFEGAIRHLEDPRLRLAAHQERIDDLALRLHQALRRKTTSFGRALAVGRERLYAQHPGRVLAQRKMALERLSGKLSTKLQREMADRRTQLGQAVASLDALSPLRVLARGYSLVTTRQGTVVKSTSDVAVGSTVNVRLSEGALTVRVEDLSPSGGR
jgi:exodeoxyribonuclease VII large subunit